MTTTTESYHEVFDWIRGKQRPLLVAHVRPDGDAFSSLFAMVQCLRGLEINAMVYLQKPVPSRYRIFAPESMLLISEDLDLSSFDALISLDAASEERLALPGDGQFSDINLPCCNLDHHIDNTRFGEICLIDSSASATAELLTALFEACDINISAATATCLLLGMVMDTGGFRFDNTSAQTLRQCAHLIECGGDYRQVMQAMFFSVPIAKLKLQAKLIASVKFAFNDRLAYYYLTPELLADCDVRPEETEDLIDYIRVLAGVDIICALQPLEDEIRFSLRSQNPDIAVNRIAQHFGGGGHVMAAGASVSDISLEDAEKMLLEQAGAVLEGK